MFSLIVNCCDIVMFVLLYQCCECSFVYNQSSDCRVSEDAKLTTAYIQLNQDFQIISHSREIHPFGDDLVRGICAGISCLSEATGEQAILGTGSANLHVLVV